MEREGDGERGGAEREGDEERGEVSEILTCIQLVQMSILSSY